MTDSDLPPDLAAVEQELSGLDRSPPAALRSRVLAAVRRELRRRARSSTWRFAATIAAAALVGINLSMSVANNAAWSPPPGIDRDQMEATAASLRRLLPELPEQEIYRQALAAQGASGFVVVPALPSSPERLLRYEDMGSWDTH
jgi:hypothetical protein